jgi:DNA-binding phage protein
MDLEKVRWFLKHLDKEKLQKALKKSPFKKGTPNIFRAEGVDWDLVTTLATLAPKVRAEDLLSVLQIVSKYSGGFELASAYLGQDIKVAKAKKGVFVTFNNRLEIKQNLSAFKTALRRIIKEREGVLLFAEKIGMKQASLSRLLNSKSMPDPQSLEKIALGFGQDGIEVRFEDSSLGQAFKKFGHQD